GSAQRLIVQWDKVLYLNGGSGEITFQAVLNQADGSVQFNYADLDCGSAGSDGGASASVGLKDKGIQGGRSLPIALDGTPSRWVCSGLSTRIALNAAPTSSPDFYAFHMDQGQRATLAVRALAGTGVSLELQDAAGNRLALATAGPGNV